MKSLNLGGENKSFALVFLENRFEHDLLTVGRKSHGADSSCLEKLFSPFLSELITDRNFVSFLVSMTTLYVILLGD